MRSIVRIAAVALLFTCQHCEGLSKNHAPSHGFPIKQDNGFIQDIRVADPNRLSIRHTYVQENRLLRWRGGASEESIIEKGGNSSEDEYTTEVTLVGKKRSGKKKKKSKTDTEEAGTTKQDSSPESILLKLWQLLLDFLENVCGLGGGRSGSLGGSRTFGSKFEQKYGTTHPAFVSGSLQDALDRARTANKFCIVFIASQASSGPRKTADEIICRSLADPSVASFIDEHFIVWCTAAAAPGGTEAAKRVGAKSLPFLGAVRASVSPTSSKSKVSTVSLHHCKPAPGAEAFCRWMKRLLSQHSGLLEEDKKAQAHLEAEIRLVREREQGYKKAIERDAIQIEKEKQEEEERLAQEFKEKAEAAAREQKEKEDAERRARKAEELEPEPITAGDGIITVMLRLLDGRKVKRRFSKESSTLGTFFDWADVEGVDLEDVNLTLGGAKRGASFEHPRDVNLTLEEGGMGGSQALLVVEAKKVLSPESSAEENSLVQENDEL